MRALTLTLGIAGTQAIALTTPAILMIAAVALTVGLAVDAIRDYRRNR